MKFKLYRLLYCLGLVAFLAVGCEQASTTEQKEAPKPPSLTDVLAEVKQMTGDISDGFANDDMEKAHGPLHQIGHKLEALPNLIDGSSLADEAKTAAKSAIETLMNEFGRVDAKLHGDESGADFADVQESIESALASLLEQTKSLN